VAGVRAADIPLFFPSSGIPRSPRPPVSGRAPAGRKPTSCIQTIPTDERRSKHELEARSGRTVFSRGALAQTLPGVTISGPSPWIDVKAYGAKGDGVTDDSTAINSAIAACPTNGCTVYFPSSATYKITGGLTVSPTIKGLKLVGECGAPGVNTPETCSHLVTTQNGIVMLTVGTAHTASHSGLLIQDLGFQDNSTTGIAGAIDLVNTDNFNLTNVNCRDIVAGFCVLFDGSGTGDTDFTQFGVVINLTAVNVKFPIQTNYQASEVNLYGGNLHCNDIANSIGMDLGKTNHSSGLPYPTGGEWGIFGTHIQDCATGISMFNSSNLNYYGIMEQTGGGGSTGDGIVIDSNLPEKGQKSIIAGSIDEFSRGVVLQGYAQDTRLLANISNTTTPVVTSTSPVATLPSTLILTPVTYPAGSGGSAIGVQIPDLTIPEESTPTAPATASRRIYVDAGIGAQDDLKVLRSDGSVADLESSLLNYQPAASPVTGTNQTVFTFSVPYIPAGKGIRTKVFWQCTTCNPLNSKTFSWKFGGASAVAYTSFMGNNGALAYTEVRIVNNSGTQSTNTMFADGITVGTAVVVAGTLSSPAQSTNAPQSLTFLFSGSDTITPQGFIVERQ